VKQKKSLDSLKQSLGGDLTAEERAYLEKLENELKGKIDYEDPEQVEAEIRRRERERVQREFKPRAPLYGAGGTKPNTMKTPGNQDETDSRKSYQSDPRYKEYYDRLRQAKGTAAPAAAGEEVETLSMDDLEKRGYPGTQRPASKPVPTPSRPAAPQPRADVSTRATTGYSDRPTGRPGAAKAPTPKYGDLSAGAIMRLDDGSIAIYKDAVSGKDYALFYFLEPDGSVAPRGIFLQQYDAIHIGHLPEPLFAEMREQGRWERDAIIFHLERYDYASYVHKVAAHQEGRRPGGARPEREATPQDTRQTPAPERSTSTPATEKDVHWFKEEELAPARDMLERGRMFKINVGGRAWEALYWGKDEMGHVVAHNTNREWALMHLDLDRFKDSMEHGELLEGDRLKEVEDSLVRNHR